MSRYIDLPCGCRINAAFVIHTCIAHAVELREKQAEADKAFDRFEDLARLGERG